MDGTPLNEDLLQKVLSRLPAKDFASAACVSKSWSKVCNRILSRPKLATALSLNAYIDTAVQEVLDKVLSEPIRPHFAIAFVGLNYNLQRTHQLITQKLPSEIPIITNTANGMIGMEARTNLIREAKWRLLEEDNVPSDFGGLCNLISQIDNCGIVLVVGRLPGLKVETIPLLHLEKDRRVLQNPKAEMIDKFLMDIKEYTASVSNCTSPDAIIMFGDERINIKPVLLHMDNNMAKDTIIVGDAGGHFIFESRDNSQNYPRDLYSTDAVALVFAKDNASNVGGKIRLSVTLSNGLVPYGPQLKVASAVVSAAENITRLTARLAGHPQIFNIQELCKELRDKTHDKEVIIYVGVTHQSECSNGSQRSYLAFYEIMKYSEANFRIAVDGVGIKPGDSFKLYRTDSKTAFSSMINAYDELKLLKTPAASTSHSIPISSFRIQNEVFGGLIFSSFSRCDSLRGLRAIESIPFSTNYPGTPVAGLFCNGEIARVSTNLISVDERNERGVGRREGEDDGSNSGGCFLHYHSTVYLVMSYNPYC